MNWLGWALVGYGVAALVAGAFTLWFGWHLNRARHVWRRPTARNRADDTRRGPPPDDLPVYK